LNYQPCTLWRDSLGPVNQFHSGLLMAQRQQIFSWFG
jgi:hypothetical protein